MHYIRKATALIFTGIFLICCLDNIANLYLYRSKKILGDYYLSPVDIDGVWLYNITPPYEGEAVKQIGIDRQYIYWSTYCTTNYKIDTILNSQVRIEKIPDEVKMIPVIEFYDMLD